MSQAGSDTPPVPLARVSLSRSLSSLQRFNRVNFREGKGKGQKRAQLEIREKVVERGSKIE
jgi:hypothetical protein